MKALAGVLQYDGGSAEVFGTVVDSERAAEQVKPRIGFLPQGLGLNLYPELSVEENIDFFATLRLVPAAEFRERKARLLAITRLDRFRGRLMKQLSGGMKQKLGLICTLIHEPEPPFSTSRPPASIRCRGVTSGPFLLNGSQPKG